MRAHRGVRLGAASMVIAAALPVFAGCAKVKVNAGSSATTAASTTQPTQPTAGPTIVTTTQPTAGPTTQPSAGGLEITTTSSATTTLVAPAGGSTLAAAVAMGDPCAVHAAVIALGPTADAATLSAAAAALTAVKGAVDRAVVTDWMWLTRDFAKRAATATDLASQRAAAVDPDAEAVELRVAAAMDRDCPM